MKQEIDPKDTARARAFELWMTSPMPMVTLTKTLNVTRLVKISRRSGMKFNMLMCYCIGKTACMLEKFNEDYLALTQSAITACQSTFVEDAMVIGTSAMTTTGLDSIVNQYTDQFCNPMVMWGRYRKSWLKTTLSISFQFHHVQMDGGHAARFLDELQKTINSMV